MEELRHFKASRKGYRTHITRTLGKVTAVTESTTLLQNSHITRTLGKVTAVTESTKPITTDQIVTLKTWLDQIEQKRAVLE